MEGSKFRALRGLKIDLDLARCLVSGIFGLYKRYFSLHRAGFLSGFFILVTLKPFVMQFTSLAGTAEFLAPPFAFAVVFEWCDNRSLASVLWVLRASCWEGLPRARWYGFRPELRLVDVAGVLDDTITPVVHWFFARIHTEYVWLQPFTKFTFGGGWPRATWIYYSRNISTTTASH